MAAEIEPVRHIVPHSAALSFLHVQRGNLFAFRGARFWGNYAEDLFAEFDSFVDYLPHECERVLDVGGGMGGLNIHIARAFDPQPQVVILDGIEDRPHVTFHRETFSNADASRAFLAANGVRDVLHVHPAVATADRIGPCDLIVSTKAWGFHLPPDEYLSLARRVLKPEGLLVMDLRKDRPEWAAAMRAAFREYQTVHDAPKFRRVLYVPRR